MKKYSDNPRARFTARHQKCLSLCGNVKDKVVLNIGCYNGWFEVAMIKSGVKKVIGIDTNDNFVKSAKQSAPKAKILKMSAMKLNLPENFFDLITIFDVIEHLPRNKVKKALREIYKVTKPNGRLIISTPNQSFFSNLLDPAWYFGHRHYQIDKLSSLLLSSGFKPKKNEVKGGVGELTSMIFLYVFKLLGFEIPFKELSDKIRRKEYLDPTYSGFATIFITASPTKNEKKG